MQPPLVVVAPTIQSAYLRALAVLRDAGWQRFNLVVQVDDPEAFDEAEHLRLEALAAECGCKTPKQVAYTIFPHHLWATTASADHLYEKYHERFLPRVNAHRHDWGTYFGRMTRYTNGGPATNQLKEIIQAMKSDPVVWKAAHWMIVPYPGPETRMRMSQPCLNYIAFQLEPGHPRRVSLLAVYRNHFFLERAYGNYWGLANLLGFVAGETGYAVGSLTCVSSHAEVEGHKRAIRTFLTESGL